MQKIEPFTHTLTIAPKEGRFLIDTDLIGGMDPFVRITIGKETKQTETAYNQGKTPVWTTPLVFELTADQVAKPSALDMKIEAFDEDPGSEDFLGRINFTLAQAQEKLGGFAILELLNGRNQRTGEIDVQFTLKKKAADSTKPKEKTVTETKKPSPSKRTSRRQEEQMIENRGPMFSRVIGTLLVKPKDGKFDVGIHNQQKLYLVFLHGESAFKTGSSEGSGKTPVFRDAINMPLYEEEDMIVRVFDWGNEKSGVLAEGKIKLSQQQVKKSPAKMNVPLSSGAKKIGEVNIELEFFTETFDNPVKILPVVSVKRGEGVNKKIRYNNYEDMPKSLIIRTEDKDLVSITTPMLKLQPNSFVEIKFKIFAPSQGPEQSCKVDVIVEEMREIEESIYFRVKNA